MAQWVQVPFTKPDDSSFIHRTHMVKGEKLLWERRGRALLQEGACTWVSCPSALQATGRSGYCTGHI